MISVKNKILSIVFLFIIAIPVLYSAYFFTRQQIIQHKMREALEQESLKTINISLDKVKWVNEGEEILINGHLFDVESYKQTGNNLQVTGLFDTEEDYLNEQIKKIEQQKSKGNNNEYALLINLLLQTVFEENNSIHNKNIFHTGLNQFRFSFDENLYSTSLNIVTPPPKDIN